MARLGVVFLTQSGSQYPGKLRFKSGLLVSAEMEGFSPWGYPDETPLDGLKFLLHFQGEKPRAVFVEQGSVIHSFEVPDQASKEEFLTNIRIARNLFVHPRVQSDVPTLDTGFITDALVRRPWLTPRAVEGFDAADFPELKADRRAALQDAVQTFKDVASQVPADKPPQRNSTAKPLVAFIAILHILNPYLPTPEESKKVGKAGRNVPFPPWVVNWDYELGSSEEGDAAIWVDVFAEGNVPRTDSDASAHSSSRRFAMHSRRKVSRGGPTSGCAPPRNTRRPPPMALHDDLLALARRLVPPVPPPSAPVPPPPPIVDGVLSCGGRPPPTTPCSTSSSTRPWRESSPIPTLRSRVSRSFDHTRMKACVRKTFLVRSTRQACRRGINSGVPFRPPNFKAIGTAFLALQQARHNADYDTAIP